MMINGVNVRGYLRTENGLGAVARGYVEVLRALGVPVALHDLSRFTLLRSESRALQEFDAEHPYDVNLCCFNAGVHGRIKAEIGEVAFRGRYNIGVWFWELPSFPDEWRSAFDDYDEIWAATSFIANTLSPISPIPVVRIPPPLPAVRPGSRERGRERLGVAPDEFVFLFVFDFYSYCQRKNPLGLIRAFKMAFSCRDRARLVIKTVNAHVRADQYAAMRELASDHAIRVCDGYWTDSEMSDLLAACDAYVSLHRSEGLSLPIADAMAAGKPVIATGWSGNMDLMSVRNSFPVGYELVEIEADAGPYRAGQQWAEPSIEHAAELMRLVYQDRDAARARGQAAAKDIAQHYSLGSVARLVHQRLAVVRLRHAAGAPLPAFTSGLPQSNEPRRALVASRSSDDSEGSRQRWSAWDRLVAPVIRLASRGR